MACSKPHLKRTVEEEKRTFQEHWEVKYLFADINNVPECLVCQKTVAVPKEYNLRRHYEALHKGQYAEFTGKIREEKVMRLKLAATRQKDIFRKVNRESEVAVEASFALSQLIAKASKPFTEGPFIKNCLIRAAEIVCPIAKDSFEKISLSANTVARRVEDMGADLEMQLRDISKNFCAYSLALDESTDINDIAQCVVFIRGVTHDLDIYEDLLPLKGTTTGSDLWSAVKGSIEAAGLKWENLASVATDGAPSMVGRNLSLVARLKETLAEEGVPTKLPAIHCILHQEALCSRVMDVVVKTVNFIRSRGLNHRLFADFLQNLDATYKDLPYHTEVRWLSRGKVLQRLFYLRGEIKEFLHNKGKECPEMADPEWSRDLAFLIDITNHLNILNMGMQGKARLITEMYDSVKCFVRKFELWEKQPTSEDLFHFPCLKAVDCKNEETLRTYSSAVSVLRREFMSRFHDFEILEAMFKLFADPISVLPEDVKPELQMELIHLQCNSTLRQKFDEIGAPEFYKYVDRKLFPCLMSDVSRVLSMFGSTYVCEQFFSMMNINKTKLRSQLSDDHLRAQLRFATAVNLQVDLGNLVRKKRPQVSSAHH